MNVLKLEIACSQIAFPPELITLKEPNAVTQSEDHNTEVEGTSSLFIWDKFDHNVTNYHVVARLATNQTGLQRCKLFV
ncbi:PREDICTED: protease Do-like 5, chloroplastic-like isoform 1 [Fragaria vesca subsp. vesca]